MDLALKIAEWLNEEFQISEPPTTDHLSDERIARLIRAVPGYQALRHANDLLEECKISRERLKRSGGSTAALDLLIRRAETPAPVASMADAAQAMVEKACGGAA